ncbi:hypothetical protein LIER_18615 [Lithospermum erythrorhizon]|uniref:Uncharacterized protein n=1 Tax=Lithospermum erythrorhizon TaxID=34254 RepID=A0AAV3QHS2_LITER
MSSCNPTSTPIDTKSKLSGTSGTPCEDPSLFRSLGGALQYLTFTRPDISYAVQQICLFMHAPMTSHMHALKRVIRYIQGVLHVSSRYQIADIFTKGLPSVLFPDFRDSLSIRPPPALTAGVY